MSNPSPASNNAAHDTPRTHAQYADGNIRRLDKDCGCLTHEGPHWLHMDTIVRQIKPNDVEAQIARLGQKLCEMTSAGIVRLLTEREASVLLAAQGPRFEGLLQIRAHIEKEADFNRTWIYLHLRDGHPEASERRKEVVAERERWIGSLDEAILALATAEGRVA